ncbi:MAG: MBL fold metallo-hydrolase [Bacteroidota bacterium]
MNNNSLSIQFLGAAGTVTGSKHLLKTPNGNYLVDCGLFQGLKALRIKNWEALPIEIGKLKAVFLTHAHLDHCGALPLLYVGGYRGKIYCSAPTRDLTEIILRDSAKIQEEDAAIANKKGFSKHKPAVPLYTEEQVKKVLELFEVVEPKKLIQVDQNIAVTYYPNGHILGSCYVVVEALGQKILFSGDVGRPVSPILNAPTPIVPADYVVMESTYGDRVHPTASVLDQLADVIVETIQQKGNVLIPSFAVGRAQELMHLVNELKKQNRIPDVPMYLDTPMGANATGILRKYPSWHKLTVDECNSMFDKVSIVSRFEETLEVIDTPGSKIVVAASGMLTGGRVLYYLEKYMENRKNTILLTGFQSEGTRGRALQNGATELKMHGSFYPVRAQVRTLGAMSGHADQSEMIQWLGQMSEPPKKLFLVHGENISRDAFRVKIEATLGWNVEMPDQLTESSLI